MSIEQGTETWKAARLGRATASRISDVIAKAKSGGYRATRNAYKAELVFERWYGRPFEHFQSAAMKRGTELEPQAKLAYACLHDIELTRAGFIEHPTIPMSGATSDYLVGKDGLVEFKCPLPHTHLETLLTETVPTEYIVQCQYQMACDPTRKWCDYTSFCPEAPVRGQLFTKRIERDNELIGRLEAEVVQFLREVETDMAVLKRKGLL
jgi:predicted phage-related endonuclease